MFNTKNFLYKITILSMLFSLTSCNTQKTSSIDYSLYESAYGMKGTEIYCWEISNNDWRCGALIGTNRNKTYEKLKTIQEDYPCPLSTMKTILSSYPDDARNSIYIRIIDYPLSIDNFVGEIPNDETLLFLKNELGLN